MRFVYLNIQTENAPPVRGQFQTYCFKLVLEMKALLITTLVMGFISVNTVSAAQQINHADGEE
ncbi:putative membrane protein [Salmonella bongori NCTC 12419]|uniref:Uncharacterized protein n=2 Tax=Salmonella bongori TaxID=54736 RepID=A0A248K871_SALBN|nr:hypothetical protein LFZ56_08430 [Salmonella bongori serovar 66:z41:- str. SA19983605]CCC30923.1 putative membrane protein [Salmonella bongori NCTC 12419]